LKVSEGKEVPGTVATSATFPACKVVFKKNTNWLCQ
jgi:hypothetical protein